ncbi:MAG: tetratricopeptide repeat protein [Planctomycetota bacterium]
MTSKKSHALSACNRSTIQALIDVPGAAPRRRGLAALSPSAALRAGRGLLGIALLVAGLAAQGSGPDAAASGSSGASLDRWAGEGRRLLRGEDLLAAQRTFRGLRERWPGEADGLLGLGEVHLQLGRADLALLYAQAARREHPSSPRAAALEVRALLRLRRFDDAVRVARRALSLMHAAGAELWAAYASALFRVQRSDDAADAYRRVLELDPLHAEAHVRLGSGLTEPAAVSRPRTLESGVAALHAGDLDRAILAFHTVVLEHPRHAVAHRLLGDALLQRLARRSMAADAPEFAALAAALPIPEASGLEHRRFLPALPHLSPERHRVAARALALFATRLPRLVAMGGRHDLLTELERTTEAPERASLRGKRTFDGRVWDDVRGIGGLRAATGIEALDEAARFGFDTLSHEIAHQAHLYAFRPVDRRRITALYEAAKAGQHFLDYYAANNEAEYFGQGVEAFASLAKRPGREATHGHTRFELYRIDRDLYDFIESVVDDDPLQDPAQRARLLPASAAVAMRCGRFADAAVAAEMMDPGPERDALMARAQRALRFAQTY